MKTLYGILLLSLILSACKKPQAESSNGAFSSQTEQKAEDIDLEKIHENGEIIIGTLSGPDTYYDYHGRGMGLQYALAENYARHEGLHLRVELASDTAQLFSMLRNSDIDIIAMQIPYRQLQDADLTKAGVGVDSLQTSWVVRSTSTSLTQSLTAWYSKGVDLSVKKEEQTRYKERRTIRRHVSSPYQDRERGIISPYDEHFKKGARSPGWYWRLIAAQCYQESGFDPQAVSWAGAKGLMQIMPGTADEFGLAEEHIFSPSHNISTAASLIRKLNQHFSDIRNREERMKFVLAAYNGGAGHVRDAMALAEKYGKNSGSWNEVSRYVLALSRPEYYRDPVVKHGYMIGSETEGYVASILERWHAYGGSPGDISGTIGNLHSSPVRAKKTNRYTKDTKILSPEEMEYRK